MYEKAVVGWVRPFIYSGHEQMRPRVSLEESRGNSALSFLIVQGVRRELITSCIGNITGGGT